MDFNFNSDKAVIVNYCPGSGGIFLRECLALSADILHPNPLFARTKCRGEWSDDQSVRASLTTMKLTKKNGLHIENDNGHSIYGFDCGNRHEEQRDQANEFARQLSNQKRYFFTLGNHSDYRNTIQFTSAKNLFITGCEKLLAKRKMSDRKDKWLVETEPYKEKLPNKIYFNIDTVFNDEQFYDEISRTLILIGASSVSPSTLEILRTRFVKATDDKFNRTPPNPNWDGKGRYRGNAYRD